jgi:hypothetical protein
MLRQKDVRNFMWLPRYDLNIHQIQWISFFELRNFITSCTCSSNLKYAKKFNKMKKKLMKYTKKFKITLNLRKEFQIMWDDFTKKWGKKTKNKKILPRVLRWGTRERGWLPRVLKKCTREECFKNISIFPHHFLFVGASLPRVLHSRKGVFPECLSSPSAMDY